MRTQIVLRGTYTQPVRKLSGFLPHHTPPKHADAYHNEWIAKIARDDLARQLEELARDLRRAMGYKRAELTGDVDGNTAGLVAPEFDFRLEVSLCADNPAEVVWRRELSNIRDGEQLRRGELEAVFAQAFNEMELNVMEPVDVAALIDALEENGHEVDYPLDASSCSIELPDLGVSVHVRPDGFIIRYPSAGSPRALLEDFDRLRAEVPPFALRFDAP